jgi:hypothetical protein
VCRFTDNAGLETRDGYVSLGLLPIRSSIQPERSSAAGGIVVNSAIVERCDLISSA